MREENNDATSDLAQIEIEARVELARKLSRSPESKRTGFCLDPDCGEKLPNPLAAYCGLQCSKNHQA
jgi:hypothetical protein